MRANRNSKEKITQNAGYDDLKRKSMKTFPHKFINCSLFNGNLQNI
jgi:hypothetical protein